MNCTYPERPSSFNSKQEGSNTFEPLAVTALKRFEPFTPAAVLLVQRISGNEKAILKLADRRLGRRGGKVGPVLWSPSLEGHLQHALRGIQEGMAPNWSELIRNDENRPDIRIECGRSPLGVTSCRTTTLGLLHTHFCSDCKAGTSPVFSASFVFVSPPSLLPYLP